MKPFKFNLHRSRYQPHAPARYMFTASGVPRQWPEVRRTSGTANAS
ncbi:MAG: hypothetical protein AB2L24_27720 [Mangrovibacterium sp.]